jgi:hypothetical protein
MSPLQMSDGYTGRQAEKGIFYGLFDAHNPFDKRGE